MAITPDGSKLYVANSVSVSVINTRKLVALKDVAVCSFPWGVVIKRARPDKARLPTSCTGCRQFW